MFLRPLSTLKGEVNTVVGGLSFSEDNYVKAVDNLKERFGRQEAVISASVQAFLNLQSDGNSIRALRKVHQALPVYVRSLESLHITNDKWKIHTISTTRAVIRQWTASSTIGTIMIASCSQLHGRILTWLALAAQELPHCASNLSLGNAILDDVAIICTVWS